LRARLTPLAPGLAPRAVLDKFAAIQMLDVHFPTTDGRTLILSRHTELTADQKILVRQSAYTCSGLHINGDGGESHETEPNIAQSRGSSPAKKWAKR
jgi:hypothetical protein